MIVHEPFVFMHAAIPVLRTPTNTVTVIENDTFSFNMELSAGYPPVPSFLWYFNGEEISPSSSNPNVSVYPQIVFSPVLRNQSGNYSMTASTEGGDSTGYIIINVHCEHWCIPILLRCCIGIV